jgi:hypothetical protein
MDIIARPAHDTRPEEQETDNAQPTKTAEADIQAFQFSGMRFLIVIR